MFRKAPANLRVDLREPGLGDARPSCSLAAERDTGPRGGCWLRPPPLVCLVNGRQASISGGNDVQSVKAAPKRLATRLPRGASSGGTCPGHRAQAGSVGPALAAAEGTKGAAAPPPCPPCPQPHRPDLCPQPPAASPLPNPADAPRPPREKEGRGDTGANAAVCGEPPKRSRGLSGSGRAPRPTAGAEPPRLRGPAGPAGQCPAAGPTAGGGLPLEAPGQHCPHPPRGRHRAPGAPTVGAPGASTGSETPGLRGAGSERRGWACRRPAAGSPVN